MGKKKVIISACLLGEMCRYDGTTKGIPTIKEKLGDDVEIIPFCPEDPILGTPRERISVIKEAGRYKVVTDESCIELTSAIKLQVDKLMSQHHDASMIILKSKSPSCGVGTTPILSSSRELLFKGNGIAAQKFLDEFPEIEIFDEHTFLDKF